MKKTGRKIIWSMASNKMLLTSHCVIMFNEVHKSQMNKKERKMTKRSPISFLSSPPVASHPVVGECPQRKGETVSQFISNG